MTTQVQRRRGTAAQHASFTGAIGELTVDTTNKRVVVHDGSTAGGFPAAKLSEAVLKADTSYSISGNQVVGPRITGWGAPSGTLDRTAWTSYAGQTVSVGYVQAEAQATDDAVKKVSQELAALITDLRTHGLIGT
ncbi:phage tail protein [Methylocystis sp. SC2]|uniref:hyaluronate lyase N-terminal domain-containing protein n=1 Tax=Methylocystis sp. (strain SC2) TaxID=187303 RepID=UPI00027AF0FA|nr:phage tail protein [Methylocystis sp. SC2]CCJ07113.1 Phage tail protein [Methylocystis sp. SC2]